MGRLNTVTTTSAATNSASGILEFVEAEFNDPGLNNPRSVVVSPNGEYVYVAGYNDDAVAVFGRDSATGWLSWIDKKENGVLGVDGLDGAHGVAVSPDSAHVYVASAVDHAVAVFDVNVNGLLVFVEAEKDGVDGVEGLSNAVSVVVSPDGNHVYVTGSYDDAVAIFSRDDATGALTYEGMVQDGVGDVEGLDGARSVAISVDGNHVYVAGEIDDAVAIFGRNSTTGGLNLMQTEQDGVGGVDGLDGAYSVAVSPTGDKVYVAGHDDSAVAVFDRDETTGALTYLAEAKEGVLDVDGLSDVTSVAVSPNGLHCYATGSTDDAVVTMQYLTWPGPWLYYKGKVQDGVGGVDGLDFAYSVTVSPDGHHVYATGLFDDAVALLRRDNATGELTFVDMYSDVGGQAGPRSVAVSPDGRHVYTASDNGNSVAVFGRSSGTGRLTFIEYKQNNVYDVHGLDDARSVVVSPDGKHVYVASYDDDAVAIFGRNSSTGKLTYLGMEQDGVGVVEGLNGAYAVAVSLDGYYVYVTGYEDDALAFFRRDAATGALTFAGVQEDGVFGVDGLDGASGVAASLDGEHVYVAGFVDDAVAVFEWRVVNHIPVLAYVEMEQDGVGDVNGLNGARAVAVSADGEHVYVTGFEEDAMADFVRNESTGELTYLTSKWDGGGGVDGLRGPSSVAVHPSTHEIFVAGFQEPALAVFERDSVTGEPAYLGMEENGVNGVSGLSGVRAVTVSPDGLHVYATGYWDVAIAVLSVFLPAYTCRSFSVTTEAATT